jgi:hypothetical protein
VPFPKVDGSNLIEILCGLHSSELGHVAVDPCVVFHPDLAWVLVSKSVNKYLTGTNSDLW